MIGEISTTSATLVDADKSRATVSGATFAISISENNLALPIYRTDISSVSSSPYYLVSH